jgi:shikimate dehydrogenase
VDRIHYRGNYCQHYYFGRYLVSKTVGKLNMDAYAVFGKPISHSKSPRIHRLFAEQTGQSLSYEAYEVAPEQFSRAVSDFFADGGKGINCTVPLKELAWAACTERTPRAELAKAVNTLAVQADGTLLGDNTDGVGLVRDLIDNHAVTLSGKHLLILGAGGATRGILTPLLEQTPACLVIANRTVEKAEQLANEFALGVVGCGFESLAAQSFDVIINATSASLSGELPCLPSEILAAQGVCYDLAYSNEPTAFVRWGQDQHAAQSLDGLGMLVEQAAEAFLLWRGVRPNSRAVIELLNAERLKA